MKKQIWRYFKHIGITFLLLFIIAVIFGLSIGAGLHYGDDPKRLILEKEGPYVFYKNDSVLQVSYLKGNKDDGFYTEQNDYPIHSFINACCYIPLDDTSFDFTIDPTIEIPDAIYADGEPIVAVSDIESGYRAFRDFLINSHVIDADLHWNFGRGHLVLVGDFVDRGFSTTQVLWFIYKLEQDAEKHGGTVHYILGNHELKVMQGMYEASSLKYHAIAAILGKQQHQLYDHQAFLGRWLGSKNAIERINGILFTHGGLHPEIANTGLDLKSMNDLVRGNYRNIYYPKPSKSNATLLNSNRTGISWYRGYFKEDLQQEQVDKTLELLNANAVVVGHTLQSKVNRQYNGKVIAIDVKHPKDYQKYWPVTHSEGLLIQDGVYYRLYDNGKRKEEF
ncbi:metallophosphoesterase [Zhouia amylolytica]|uniref:Calcineurin-like phosphoesterase domain-containing protein n=1 Tax=Zhouia amylolytica AD3 TaxID=1286632 RepID=W2URD7_9FLAO|nr:metallophosphoesterase [Zhouia amylolytica]ETN95872.1 hypothetical protein P278_15940 [Zhouia amylolytica AD3]